MTSLAGSNSSIYCGDDGSWRLDNFFLFTPYGCLHQSVHFGLMCFWLSALVYSLVDFLLSLIFFPVPFSFLAKISYVIYHIGHIGLTLVVVIDPYATVTNRSQGLALTILFSIGISANEIFACEVTTRFVNSLVGALAVSVGKDSFDLRYLKRLMVVFEVTAVAFCFVFWVILPFSLTNPEQQQFFFDIGIILLGIFSFAVGLFLSIYGLRLRSIAVAQIKFVQNLASGDNQQASLTSLNDLTKRILLFVVISFLNTVMIVIVVITIVTIFQTPWWLIHFAESAAIVLTINVQALDGSGIIRLIKRSFQSSGQTSPTLSTDSKQTASHTSHTTSGQAEENDFKRS